MLLITKFSVSKVLDSKGIREAVQEKNPLKALESFAIRDVIDGVDSPLIVLEARGLLLFCLFSLLFPLVLLTVLDCSIVLETTLPLVSATVEVSAVFVKIGVTGGLTCRVEIDLYDPFPDTSGGLIRPFQLLALAASGDLTPLDWFEITLTITLNIAGKIIHP